jgi:hypothetical protein
MITVLAAAMLGEGTEVYGDHEWTDASPCECTVCQWRGKVADARVKCALHYLNAGDEENNADLAVWAESPAEALAIWRRYYDTEPEAEPARMWRLTPHQPHAPGALPWHECGGAELVEWEG